MFGHAVTFFRVQDVAVQDKVFINLHVVLNERGKVSLSPLFIYASVLGSPEMGDPLTPLFNKVFRGHKAGCVVIDDNFVAVQPFAYPVDENHGNIILDEGGEMIVFLRFHGQRYDKSADTAIIECLGIGDLMFVAVVRL